MTETNFDLACEFFVIAPGGFGLQFSADTESMLDKAGPDFRAQFERLVLLSPAFRHVVYDVLEKRDAVLDADLLVEEGK